MIDKSHIDPNALNYYRMLKEAGFSAYFVGGAVRDLLLGKHPKDFDIATNATPHQIKRVIPYGRIIGRRFRHVMLERDGGRYEIVTFRGPIVHANQEPEATEQEGEAPQENEENSEMAEGAETTNEAPNQESDRRRNHPDLNQFGTAEQDALRRDFTVNALFYDPDADELVDYVNGKQDVENRLLRTIGEPMVRMEEDPIRILRAIRHRSKLDLEYDAALEEAMRAKAPLLENTSKDRIREEFLKVCNDRSLVSFLTEAKRLGLFPYFAPWFNDVSEEDWDAMEKVWRLFSETPNTDRTGPELGVALMMAPLVKPLVLEPYKAGLEPDAKNYLPDMKYFLSSEPLRNFFLRNLRVSRIQTDHIVRALFYWSRMTGLWLENGPPRKIVGKLHHHPPAVLAAKMAVLTLRAHNENAEIPEWLQNLADYDSRKRQGRDRNRQDRDDRRDHRSHDENAMDASASEGEENEEAPPRREREREREERPRNERQDRNDRRRDRGDREDSRSRQVVALPPPDKPLVWNGPLHAPVLRPLFNEEPTQRWARRNQTIRAYRPSGIPNQPVDYALLKAGIVANYKPELQASESEGEDNHRSGNGGGRRRNGRRGGRDDSRENRGPREERRPANEEENQDSQSAQPENDIPEQRPVYDEDSVGNIRAPGELPSALAGTNEYEEEEESDIDDNIGNRLDAPPTSGHVGVNGDGVLGSREFSRNARPPRQGGGSGGNRGNRGGRRRRGGRSGGRGGNRGGFRGGTSHNNPK